MDFYDKVADHLLTTLILESPQKDKNKNQHILFRPLNENDSGIAILDVPSTTGDRYLNRQRIYNWSFQVVVKNKSQKVAMTDSFKVYQELDDFPRRGSNGKIVTLQSDFFQLIKCEGTTIPRMFEITEHNSYLYIMVFEAELLINGK